MDPDQGVEPAGEPATEFVWAATGGRRHAAEALLAAHPKIEADLWARLVLGRDYYGDAKAAGGPRGWAPLLYACHSVFAPSALARELIERGADPNAFFANEHGSMSALYGAAGVVHDSELTGLLLEAGADPDDGESLYHATETEEPECLRLLLEHGAEPGGTNALAHALDEERLEHVRLLLEAGADPNEGALLAHAVRRGRGADELKLLAAYGADLNRPGGETWRGDVPLRTAYQHAFMRGRFDLTEALAGLGAASGIAAEDRAVAALARGERPPTPLPDELDPDGQEVVILAALRGRLETIVEVVGPNFGGVVGGSPWGTLLHHAAWVGDPRAAAALVAAGADPVARVNAGFETPLGWAVGGSEYHEEPGRDYVAVARLLAEAGAEIEPGFREAADGPLYDWLSEQPG